MTGGCPVYWAPLSAPSLPASQLFCFRTIDGAGAAGRGVGSSSERRSGQQADGCCQRWRQRRGADS
eukprot:361821-Chlamydomonas_euryale.AAC.3